MKKKSFLIDMDGVLVNSVKSLLALHEKETGIHIKLSQITTYNIEVCTGIKGLNKYWCRPEIYEGLDLTDDAKKLVRLLNKHGIDYEVQSLSMSSETSALKAKILERNGVKRFKFVDFNMVKDFDKFEYVIEDNPYVAKENYNKLFMVERPYNIGLLEDENLKYIKSMDDNRLLSIIYGLAS